MPKLTKEFVEQIEFPASGQVFYRDTEVPGFGVRTTPKCKSYIFERRVGRFNMRKTIGKCNKVSFDNAKKKALIMLGDIEKGNDPRSGNRISSDYNVTLRQAFDKLLETKPMRETTRRSYLSAMKHFDDWLDLPLTEITKDMVEQRHQDLTAGPNRPGTSGHGRANNALKKLSAVFTWAMDRFGTDDNPIIKSNPVSRLSCNRTWHKPVARQRILSDLKLKDWYRAINQLKDDTAKDFLLFLLLTSLRHSETRNLQWSHIEFENKLLVLPRELTKSDREHTLPLSEFLLELLKRRHLFRRNSLYVFPSKRLMNKPFSAGSHITRKVSALCGAKFSFHDLRRTFITMGAKLKVPEYILKRLLNHSITNDITKQYLVLDIDILRFYMNKITRSFLVHFGITGDKKIGRSSQYDDASIDVIQLQLPLDLNPEPDEPDPPGAAPDEDPDSAPVPEPDPDRDE
jgi:integrase